MPGKFGVIRRKDLVGKKFGKLTVLSFSHLEAPKRTYWVCECECGTVKTIRGDGMTSGAVISCSCVRKERAAVASTLVCKTHGYSRSPTYRSWGGMFQRCYNVKEPKYPGWGGRGITVCERWRKFENFLEDMGEKPARLTIDRINVNGNYEPGNCRWADAVTQRNNRRDSVKKAA